MSDFKKAIESIVKNNGEPDWLKNMRLGALDQFEKISPPTKKEDEWRRADISRVLFSDLNVHVHEVSYRTDSKMWRPDIAGSYPHASIFLSEGGDETLFLPLSEAVKKFPEKVRPYIEMSHNRNVKKYSALANALWNGGAFLHVSENKNVEVPLAAFVRPSEKNPAGEGQNSFFTKIIVVLEEKSSATFVLDELSRPGWEGWRDSALDIYLKPGSHLSFIKIQRMGRNVTALSSLYSSLEKNSSLNFLTVDAGSAFAKSDSDILLGGEGASAKIYGIVKGEGTQHFEGSFLVDHNAPITQSDLLCKTVLKDKARSVFSGLIHVRKNARKTEARQTNRNLLLSRQARADTIPKLEIETEDVRCGHAAAVSGIDEEQLYYLMCRGLNRGEAEALIVEGFYEDVVAQWSGNSAARPESEKSGRDKVLSGVREILVGQNSLLPQEESIQAAR